MKIAISISAKTFDLAESLAKRLKVSRSKIFAMGIEKLGEEFDRDEITKKLNDFYTEHQAEDESEFRVIATRSLESNEW
jgi:hypothetical protein